jgi:hypothetical protein
MQIFFLFSHNIALFIEPPCIDLNTGFLESTIALTTEESIAIDLLSHPQIVESIVSLKLSFANYICNADKQFQQICFSVFVE